MKKSSKQSASDEALKLVLKIKRTLKHVSLRVEVFKRDFERTKTLMKS